MESDLKASVITEYYLYPYSLFAFIRSPIFVEVRSSNINNAINGVARIYFLSPV